MAWTTTKQTEAVIGNYRHQTWYLVADSTTLELSTGLKNVQAVAFAPVSCATNPLIRRNVNSAAAANGGMVYLSGVTSGNEMYLTVIGS